MQAKLIDEQDRVYALIFGTGEDPMAELAQFAEYKLSASSFTAIGAFSEGGYFAGTTRWRAARRWSATHGWQLHVVLGKREARGEGAPRPEIDSLN